MFGFPATAAVRTTYPYAYSEWCVRSSQRGCLSGVVFPTHCNHNSLDQSVRKLPLLLLLLLVPLLLLLLLLQRCTDTTEKEKEKEKEKENDKSIQQSCHLEVDLFIDIPRRILPCACKQHCSLSRGQECCQRLQDESDADARTHGKKVEMMISPDEHTMHLYIQTLADARSHTPIHTYV